MKSDVKVKDGEEDLMRGRIFLLILMALFASLWISPEETVEAQTDPVWLGEYFNNTILAEPVVIRRQDADISFDWGFGSPGTGIGENQFSARWGTDVTLPAGTYRFWALADDNIRIIIDYSNVILDTFATGIVDQLVSADVTLDGGPHHIQVDYRELTDQAFVYVDFANLATNPAGPDFAPPINPSPVGAWTAEYYANPNLAGGAVAVRGEAQPGGNWGAGAPVPALPNDNWSARWFTTLTLEGGEYLVRTTADDGVRVFIDGNLIINEWHIAAGREYTAQRFLSTGQHTVTVEYFEAGGLASLDFALQRTTVSPPADGTLPVTIRASRLNVRNAPSLSGDILTRVNFGETYFANARSADSQWVRINVNGVVGWVSTAFVSIPDLLALPVIGEAPQQPTGYTVTATPFTVNIRTGPGTQFRDIGNLPAGTSAQVIGRNAEATWWQINYGGIVGWSSAQYAILESGADLGQIPITG